MKKLEILMILLGGLIGTYFRVLFEKLIFFFLGPHFFFTVPLINLTGCLLAGFFYTLSDKKKIFSLVQRNFFLIGVLSAYTTFSQFIENLVNYLDYEHYLLFSANLLFSIFGGFFLFILGKKIAKKI